MSEEAEEAGETEIVWTPKYDAYSIWGFMMNPIGGICDFLSVPDDIPKNLLQDRFFEILKSPELQKRANKYMNYDLVHFHRVKFSIPEEYQTFNASRLLRNNNPIKILRFFQPTFHLTRSPNSIVALQFKKKQMNTNYNTCLSEFIKYKKYLISLCTKEELDELNFDYTPDDFAPYIIQNLAQQMTPVNIYQTFANIANYLQIPFRKNDFYAIRGPGSPHIINKAICKIGRQSLFSEDGLDVCITNSKLKKLSRHHATISLSTDMNFYLAIYGENAIVNGLIFRKGKIIRIRNGDVIDLGGYLFIFIENMSLMSSLREACSQNA
ncbi:Microspherule protein 1 [Tritrichomonas musculus]|uniref:Microspherule protein 1 n=1 Tax=Tritrichomonas musculus TaxID=1915356 RepID=A0ABR2LB97_9EUKA